MTNIYNQLTKPFTVLAPLDDVSDVVFRKIVSGCAKPDLFFTEFVNVDGLQSIGREKLLHKLWKTDSDDPLIAQLWGKTPDNYYKTAKELVAMGFAGIDINMGCPDKAVVKNGCCIALINNRDLAKEIIDSTRSGATSKLPISVKTRLGFNDIDLSWHEFLLSQKLDALFVHGRTKKEMSLVPAHWDVINQIRIMRDKISPKTKIIGNGDIKNKAEALEYAAKYKLDGIMIGRGIFENPYAFSDNFASWSTEPSEKKIALYRKHVQLFKDTYPKQQRSFNTLKRFAKVYINNFNGANSLREQVVSQKTIDELVEVLDSWQGSKN
ncbi:MAG TPA: tRNA-dihydrouridine synthase [Candidatus Saccharimonadales bacterium]